MFAREHPSGLRVAVLPPRLRSLPFACRAVDSPMLSEFGRCPAGLYGDFLHAHPRRLLARRLLAQAPGLNGRSAPSWDRPPPSSVKLKLRAGGGRRARIGPGPCGRFRSYRGAARRTLMNGAAASAVAGATASPRISPA